MVLRVDMVVDGKWVESLGLSYSMESEIRVLEAVFPKRHWSDSNTESRNWFTDYPGATGEPPAFDFVANEDAAREAMEDYMNEVTDDDTYPLPDAQAEWVKDFWRVYNAGLALQRQGKTPRVSIG